MGCCHWPEIALLNKEPTMHVFRLIACAAMLATASFSAPALAQGQTRTLEDLVAEYRAQCGKNGSKERLLVAFDRAIAATKSKKRKMLLQRRRDLVANPQAPVCPDEPAVTATAPTPAPGATASTGEPAVEDVCKQPAPNPRAGECEMFKLLLGRWQGGRYGTVIETVLTPEGTIIGTIVQLGKRGKDHGYKLGMVVLQGFKPALSGGTWIVTANGGQSLNSNVYDRQVEAGWTKTGDIMVITKDNPNFLGFPSGLQLRLADADNWTRM
jgi:hypothetical protein